MINVWISLYIDLQWLLPIYHDNNIDEWDQTVVVVFFDKQCRGFSCGKAPALCWINKAKMKPLPEFEVECVRVCL